MGELDDPVVFRLVWNRACRAAGLGRVRPEWLRHTGASLAYAASKDMKAVASRPAAVLLTTLVFAAVLAVAKSWGGIGRPDSRSTTR